MTLENIRELSNNLTSNCAIKYMLDGVQINQYDLFHNHPSSLYVHHINISIIKEPLNEDDIGIDFNVYHIDTTYRLTLPYDCFYDTIIFNICTKGGKVHER